MSRYILVPGNTNLLGLQSYLLLPAEGFSKQVKELKLPPNLNPHAWLYTVVNDVGKLKKLLFKLSKTSIERTKDGFVSDNNETLNVNYDKAIVFSCNGVFSNSFERFYRILRKNGITF